MIAIIDYGVGNLFSLKSSFGFIGEDVTVTNDKSVIDSADKIILPGVGAFGDAAQKLAKGGMDEVLRTQAKKGKYIMGICLGHQLLFDKGYEYGEHNGLGLINGNVKPIDLVIDKGLKIPHIGWNSLLFGGKKDPIFKYINEGDYVYFVHSFFATDCESSTIATTNYGGVLTAAARQKNVYGMQFHPEKSGEVGLNILKAFCEF